MSTLAALLTQLRDQVALDEAGELLKQRYFSDWTIADSEKEREKLYLKMQMVDEVLQEFYAIIQ